MLRNFLFVKDSIIPFCADMVPSMKTWKRNGTVPKENFASSDCKGWVAAKAWCLGRGASCAGVLSGGIAFPEVESSAEECIPFL